MNAIADRELAELCEVSARIGADPLLIQGPGGNTSFKSGDELWVKASGAWLAEACARPIFVGVSLAKARHIATAGQTADFTTACLPGSNPSLRPSIETAFHALMPHRAVVHAHAVGSMLVSILESGPNMAAKALAGLDWAWVPYFRPGAPLAAAVAKILSGRHVDVLMLQNHGVIIGAETPKRAEVLLREIESRLDFPVRLMPQIDSAPLVTVQTDRYESISGASVLAHVPELFEAVTAAALFPDQVVFLGGAVPATAPGETIDEAADRTRAESGIAPALILWQGIGAYGARNRTPAASAVIHGLCEVVRRLPVGARIQGLPHEAVTALLNWEAEAYRVNLAGCGEH